MDKGLAWCGITLGVIGLTVGVTALLRARETPSPVFEVRRDASGLSDDELVALIVLLQELDHQQQRSDEDGDAEVAWYYWRDEIEDVLRLPRGTLDTEEA